MDERRQAQAIFIAMNAQAQLLDALVAEGALSVKAAKPIVGNIIVVTNAWESFFPEGRDLMSSILPQLRERLGFAEDDDA